MRSLDAKLAALGAHGLGKYGASSDADLSQPVDLDESVNNSDDEQSSPNLFSKRMALVAALLLAISPFLVVHYLDTIAQILGGDRSADGRKVAFSKQIEYR